ncbi:MAG: SDR family NAD(P)-dependent oxidoreductase [Thermodesulfobacteriota bacterium]
MDSRYEDLKGKTVLVTGGAGGIGGACAEAFARQGAGVIITGRNEERLQAMVHGLQVSYGDRFRSVACDIATDAGRERLFKDLPPVDVLVNNAGINIPRPFTENRPEDFDAVFNINIRALYFVTQTVVRRMIEDKRAGRIVNVSSQAGLIGLPLRTVYCASKHAVEGFTKSLAVDLKGKGINVNNVAPTFVETELTRKALSNEDFRDYVQGEVLLEELPKTRDIANAVLFLSSEASRFITGATLTVDAGWTAH